MAAKRFLDNGSPLATTVAILKKNAMIKIQTPDKMAGEMLPPGALARIHSHQGNTYTVWVLDDRTMSAVIIEFPLQLMGQYFRQHPHNMFPHLAG